MTITVTISNPRHIAAANAVYLASIPAQPEPPADPIPGPYADVQDCVQKAIEAVCTSWADTTKVDHIAVAAFVRRFPGTVMEAITASTDPVVIQILATIDSVTHVRLGADTTVNGMAYLVGAGYLTQAQSDVILAY